MEEAEAEGQCSDPERGGNTGERGSEAMPEEEEKAEKEDGGEEEDDEEEDDNDGDDASKEGEERE